QLSFRLYVVVAVQEQRWQIRIDLEDSQDAWIVCFWAQYFRCGESGSFHKPAQPLGRAFHLGHIMLARTDGFKGDVLFERVELRVAQYGWQLRHSGASLWPIYLLKIALLYESLIPAEVPFQGRREVGPG